MIIEVSHDGYKAVITLPNGTSAGVAQLLAQQVRSLLECAGKVILPPGYEAL
ncbi:hypothetical protein [Sphingobium quisquiliarum]|uniref:hypothetical protein n=1 Tax=Sphingobium quisquiliarum TaxID=538379 RepID=UPI001378EF4C|nr:hypothetical protein [Sphingobium quisquiliarum]